MMASPDIDGTIETVKVMQKMPEGIGITEDSGFASIAGSVAPHSPDSLVHHENVNADIDDTKFSDIPTIQAESLAKNKIDEAKREADAEYLREENEQTYKRLMHLLDRSKFYSNFLMKKMNNSDAPDQLEVGKKRKRKTSKNKQGVVTNAIPIKRSKRIAKENKMYDLEEYIADDLQKKIRTKMNLSQEEIAQELNAYSDDDETQTSSNAAAFMKPKYFVGDLYKYQEEGVQWLTALYENGLCGILADEMGLGKTIQVIALLCSLVEKKQPGPYLIIVPLSVLSNWMMEFQTFAPSLNVVQMYGNKAERRVALNKINLKNPMGFGGFKTQPIVVTTYDTVFREENLRRHKWRYIIIDEGHRIKNHECKLVDVLKKFQSVHRLILTGTPLQNNLAELWSLLHFLLPDIFKDLDVFESWFNPKELQNDEGTRRFLKQEQDKQVMSLLREILKPFMLRREKNDVNLNIPAKKEIIIYTPLTELQRDLYAATVNRDFQALTKIEAKSLILDDETGVRPKRKCLSHHKYSTTYKNPYEVVENGGINSADTSNDNDLSHYRMSQVLENPPGNKNKLEDKKKNLETWKQYANITDRNHEYFLHLTMNNRMSMYKKIINHPYLVHCPLDDAGLPNVDEELVNVSGKLLILDAMLKKLNERGHKVLLFSTMTMILDVIADYLMLRPWKHVRLDGALSNEKRNDNIKLFNNDPSIFLFLISTRAGGVGLNLTAADTVIMYDSDWNPQADLQAMARCHRIGQTRPVVIYKLCAKGTVDEAIIQRAEAKRKLEKMVISKDIKLNLSKAETILELKRLLDSSESEIVTSKNKVFTEDELNELMDRSDLFKPTREAGGPVAKTTKESADHMQ